MKIVSQKQARFLGFIAGGGNAAKGPSKSKATTMLKENRGMKMRNLPVRAPSRAPKRNPSRRGGR